jgi:hypothetical protein
MWYRDTTKVTNERSLKVMPKRGNDADSRIFFDELVSVGVSRLKATGVVRLEDRHGIIAFGDKQKLVGVAIPFSKTAARGPILSVQNVVEGKGFGWSTMHHSAGSASKNSVCATARPMASAALSV